MDVAVKVVDRGHAVRRVISIFYFISFISEISFCGYLRCLSFLSSQTQIISGLAWGCCVLCLLVGLCLICCNTEKNETLRYILAFFCSMSLVGLDGSILVITANDTSFDKVAIGLSAVGIGIAVLFHFFFMCYSISTTECCCESNAERQDTIHYSPTTNSCIVLQETTVERLEPSAPPLDQSAVHSSESGHDNEPTQCEYCKDKPVCLVFPCSHQYCNGCAEKRAVEGGDCASCGAPIRMIDARRFAVFVI